jgi:hypothetical protein
MAEEGFLAEECASHLGAKGERGGRERGGLLGMLLESKERIGVEPNEGFDGVVEKVQDSGEAWRCGFGGHDYLSKDLMSLSAMSDEETL